MSTVDNTTSPPVVNFPPRLVYGIFQTGQLIAIPAYIFVLGHLFWSKTLRNTLSNHVIIVLLCVNFLQTTVDQSLLLNYLRTGQVSPPSSSLCLFWLFIDAYTFDTGIILMCWASIERHILVFHSHWVVTQRDRLLFHYLPLLLILLYTFGFFIYAMLLFPCQNSFDYTAAFCDYACFYSSTIIVAYESLAHEAVPIILIGLFSIGLLIRFIVQKRRQGQMINLRRMWKMTIQLFSISTLYFATNFPYTINPIATFVFGTAPISDDVQGILLNYISAVLPIALPYVCLGLLPNIRQKLKCCKQQTSRVGPTVAGTSKQ